MTSLGDMRGEGVGALPTLHPFGCRMLVSPLNELPSGLVVIREGDSIFVGVVVEVGPCPSLLGVDCPKPGDIVYFRAGDEIRAGAVIVSLEDVLAWEE